VQVDWLSVLVEILAQHDCFNPLNAETERLARRMIWF
jgi:hypothetical protein